MFINSLTFDKASIADRSPTSETKAKVKLRMEKTHASCAQIRNQLAQANHGGKEAEMAAWFIFGSLFGGGLGLSLGCGLLGILAAAIYGGVIGLFVSVKTN